MKIESFLIFQAYVRWHAWFCRGFAHSTNLGEVESVGVCAQPKLLYEMQYIEVCASVLFCFLHYNADLRKRIFKTMWKVVLQKYIYTPSFLCLSHRVTEEATSNNFWGGNARIQVRHLEIRLGAGGGGWSSTQ